MLGVVLRLVFWCRKYDTHEGVPIYVSSWFPGGIALGEQILLNDLWVRYPVVYHQTSKHEYGHIRQSRMLGPLYLIVVGLPSITFASLTALRILKSKDYYKRYPENWADRLGGVDRF